MKKLTLLFTLFMLAITPLKASASQANALYAVAFHADWCGSCKAIGPQLEKARQKNDLDSQNVLFVKLDLTDKITRNQARLTADAIGLGEFYKKNDGKTGFVLLVDSKTGKSVGKITKEMNANQITALITETLPTL